MYIKNRKDEETMRTYSFLSDPNEGFYCCGGGALTTLCPVQFDQKICSLHQLFI